MFQAVLLQKHPMKKQWHDPSSPMESRKLQELWRLALAKGDRVQLENFRRLRHKLDEQAASVRKEREVMPSEPQLPPADS